MQSYVVEMENVLCCVKVDPAASAGPGLVSLLYMNAVGIGCQCYGARFGVHVEEGQRPGGPVEVVVPPKSGCSPWPVLRESVVSCPADID